MGRDGYVPAFRVLWGGGPATACLHADMANARCDWRRAPQPILMTFILFSNLSYLFCSTILGDGPTVVFINFFLRSISKIDDYKMVSEWAVCQSCQVLDGCPNRLCSFLAQGREAMLQ